jgi:GNAT superfamily N-acetyltransferase
MPPRRRPRSALAIRPLTPDRWPDFEKLFGARGACGGCWCMWWRLKSSQFEQRKGAANKKAFKRIVNSGEVPGLLAYLDKEPVGWCALGPREIFVRLLNSRILKRVDSLPVWSVVCLFVNRAHRHEGISVALLKAAVGYASTRGATILEGYPTEPASGDMPDAFVWTGIASGYRRAGFVEVLRRSKTRPIMRFDL